MKYDICNVKINDSFRVQIGSDEPLRITILDVTPKGVDVAKFYSGGKRYLEEWSWNFFNQYVLGVHHNTPTSKYYVWSPNAGAPNKAHSSLEEAEKEAKRLTKLNTGYTFYVLKTVSSFQQKLEPISKITYQ